VLTRLGSDSDARHRLAWQLLGRDKTLPAEYAALKRETHDDAER
jgi:hypothetical protein